MASLIRAAGGVVWRLGDNGEPAVCLVHRPRYGDWSLPKGKLMPDEHPLAAAVREVREETGVRAALQVPLPPVRYRVGGRPKVVDYWEMRTLAVPPFHPNSEVDDLTWSPAAAAAERVHYLHDARLLREWAQRPRVTAVVLLVASTGTDSDDPCPVMALFAPSALHTRPGGENSLAPLSAALNIPVTVDPQLEHTGAAQIRRLAGHRPATVVCLSRTALCAALTQLSGTDPQSRKSAGADAWLLPFAGDRALAPAPLHWSI